LSWGSISREDIKIIQVYSIKKKKNKYFSSSSSSSSSSFNSSSFFFLLRTKNRRKKEEEEEKRNTILQISYYTCNIDIDMVCRKKFQQFLFERLCGEEEREQTIKDFISTHTYI
jgi:hypothetical protein